MHFLHESHTYELVALLKGKRALKNKWAHKIKHDENSPQPRYKARLVMKGFGQKKSIDFDEIFSSIVKVSSSRNVLSLAASFNFET